MTEYAFCRVEDCKERTVRGLSFCEKHTTTGLRAYNSEDVRVALVRARRGIIRTMCAPGVKDHYRTVMHDSDLRQIDRLIGLEHPRGTRADDELVERFLRWTWKEI